MKMFTATRVAALAVGLSLVGGQAFADPSDNRGRRNNESTATDQQDKDQGDRGHRRQKQQPPQTTAPQPPAPAVNPVVLPTPQNNGRWQNRTRKDMTDNRRGRNNLASDRGSNKPNALTNDNRRDWGNNDRRGKFGNKDEGKNWGNQNRRRHVDVTRYNRNFDAPRRFHVDRYRAHSGYSYRRYGYGQRLPGYYHGRNFWLANFLAYGLFSPPPGYVWVRYGPDALLIDEYTGEIVQVRYNMFYS